jgi:uncharacterized protein YjeT (DUF2065 family)
MIYHFTLKNAAFAAGLVLVLLSLPGLFAPAATQRFARALPRSRVAGIFLLTIGLIWSFWLLATMEMGEFAPFRRMLLIALPIGFVLVLRFVDEFLAVRAIGILCLLAAEPLLDAAFLRYEGARLVLTVLAYVLVVIGLFWVTMPYLLRDQLDWSARSNNRWRLVHSIGVGYGVLLLVLALGFY